MHEQTVIVLDLTSPEISAVSGRITFLELALEHTPGNVPDNDQLRITSIKSVRRETFSLSGDTSNTLVDALAKVADPDCPPDSIIAIYNPGINASLNLGLPIRDPKTLDRVIPMEVQDLVPFELSEMALSYKVVGLLRSETLGAETSDIHVSMSPINEIAEVLAKLKSANLDPVAIIPRPVSLSFLYRLLPETFQDNSCVANFVWADHDSSIPVAIELLVRIDGAIRGQKLLRAPLPVEEGAEDSFQIDNVRYLFANVLLELNSIERRYSSSIGQILLLNGHNFTEQLSTMLRKPVVTVDSTETLQKVAPDFAPQGEEAQPTDQQALSELGAAILAHDLAPAAKLEPIVNFRAGRLRYKPHFAELLRGAKSIAKPACAASLTLALALLAVFYFREFQLQSLNSSLSEALQSAGLLTANDTLVLSDGRYDRLVENRAFELDQQLKDLVSPFSLSPLEAFIEVSKDLPTDKGIIVKSFNVRGTKLTLSGYAPEYSSIDEFEKVLKNKKSIYCRYKKTTSSGVNNRKEFNFDITLCDEQSTRKGQAS